MWHLVMLAVGLATAVSGEALAQQQAQQPAAPAVPVTAFVNLSRASKDYQLGPGDVLEIRVVEHDELTETLRISNSGELSYPMVGLIRLAGMTVFDAENAIATCLREAKLLEQPDVLIFIAEYQAKPIYVSGAVVNPGQFVMAQELTVAEAILLAGGLAFNAADEGLVHRRRTTGGGADSAPTTAALAGATRPDVETIKVDLAPIKQGRFLESALPLKAGDVLVVPELRMRPFYVVGEVIDPRNFFYPPGRTLTVSQAISWAGGPTLTAKMSHGILVRFDEQGRRTERKVDYAAILRGKQEDFPIQPHDIIFVPGSRVKNFYQGFVDLTDDMAMGTSFRVARTYQLPDAPVRGPGQD